MHFRYQINVPPRWIMNFWFCQLSSVWILGMWPMARPRSRHMRYAHLRLRPFEWNGCKTKLDCRYCIQMNFSCSSDLYRAHGKFTQNYYYNWRALIKWRILSIYGREDDDKWSRSRHNNNFRRNFRWKNEYFETESQHCTIISVCVCLSNSTSLHRY